MAINLHTDPEFERCLEWLSRQTRKTKTAVIKDLVLERYRIKKVGFQKGSLKLEISSRTAQKELKELDEDHDLD